MASAKAEVRDASRKLRIGFIHPDLGIGGAERLVVDAAVSLQKRGHEVVMFTSRHDPKRCFEETRDGTLQVHVLGSSLPRRLTARFPLTIIFSILRSLALTILLCLSLLLPGPASAFNPLSPLDRFDVFFVDQQSVCVPLLRFITGTRVVFYCHFPDKLLSGGWEVSVDTQGQGGIRKRGVPLLKRLYRLPIDKLEEWTTGQADLVLSNSHFTSKVYARAFPSLAKRPPRVVYPCIDVDAYAPRNSKGKGRAKHEDDVDAIRSDRPTFISLNRFETKKNAALAIKAFAELRNGSVPGHRFSDLRLVIGGGYDRAEADNVNTLYALRTLCNELALSHFTIPPGSTTSPAESDQVVFLLNFTTAQRSYLLSSPNIIALLYTPANEHFGIVPIESMACGLPVIAADSGGPTETIIDLSKDAAKGTGLLRAPEPEGWSRAMADILALSSERRQEIAKAGRQRVIDHFSTSTLGRELEEACVEAVRMPDLHNQMGDRLIYGGLTLMGLSGAGLAIVIWLGQQS